MTETMRTMRKKAVPMSWLKILLLRQILASVHPLWTSVLKHDSLRKMLQLSYLPQERQNLSIRLKTNHSLRSAHENILCDLLRQRIKSTDWSYAANSVICFTAGHGNNHEMESRAFPCLCG